MIDYIRLIIYVHIKIIKKTVTMCSEGKEKIIFKD